MKMLRAVGQLRCSHLRCLAVIGSCCCEGLWDAGVSSETGSFLHTEIPRPPAFGEKFACAALCQIFLRSAITGHLEDYLIPCLQASFVVW